MRLRPMGVGDVLDETFRLYRRHFRTFVLATALMQAPSTVVSTIFDRAFGVASGSGESGPADEPLAALFESVVDLGELLVTSLLGLIVTLPMTALEAGAVVRLSSDAILGRPLDVVAVYRASLRRLFPLLLVDSVIYLVPLALFFTCIGLPPAAYLAATWAVSEQAVVLERTGAIPGLGRSAELVRGHRWRVLGISTALLLLLLLLTLVPSFMVGLIQDATVGSTGLDVVTSVVVETVRAIANAFIASLFGSLGWIGSTVVYYELRVRKEAFDLEQRV